MLAEMIIRISLTAQLGCCSNPCQNSGVCVQRESGYICDCRGIWHGPLCDLTRAFDVASASVDDNADVQHAISATCQHTTIARWLTEPVTLYVIAWLDTTKNDDRCSNWLTTSDVRLSYGATGVYNTSSVGYCRRNVQDTLVDLVQSNVVSCNPSSEPYVNSRNVSPDPQLLCEVRAYGTKHEDGACGSYPCENNGTCSLIDNGYQCDCKGGTAGTVCATFVPPDHALCTYRCEHAWNGAHTECTAINRHSTYDVMHMTGVPENWVIGRVFAKVIIQDAYLQLSSNSTELVRYINEDLSMVQRWSLSDEPPVLRWMCVTATGSTVGYPLRLFELHIHLLDVNDHDPSAILPRNLTLSEATYRGEMLWKVELTDGDPTNRWFTVSIIGSNSAVFGYDSVITSIMLLTNVDYEETETLNCTIHIQDGHPEIREQSNTVGTGHLAVRTADITFTITVINVNDERPRFTQNTYPAIIEPTSKHGDILNTTYPLQAIDDSEGALNYSLMDISKSWDKASNYYSIDRDQGFVMMLENAYRRGSVMLVIEACEVADPTSCAYAMLNVTARNNEMHERPEFGRYVYEAHISENVTMGQPLVVVRVRNADRYPYLEYHVNRESQSQGDFVVNGKTGAIKARFVLDYETEKEHTFSIYASDGDYTTSAVVRILVKDYNEFAPSFSLPSYTFNAERVKGQSIGRVNFTDGDVHSRPTLRVEKYAQLFSVNQSGHVILLAEANSYLYNDYKFTLTLLDTVPPKKQVSARIAVKFSHISEVAEGRAELDITHMAFVVIGACILVGIFVCLYSRLKKSSKRLKRNQHRRRLASVKHEAEPRSSIQSVDSGADFQSAASLSHLNHGISALDIPKRVATPHDAPKLATGINVATPSPSAVDMGLTSFTSVVQSITSSHHQPGIVEVTSNSGNASLTSVSNASLANDTQ